MLLRVVLNELPPADAGYSTARSMSQPTVLPASFGSLGTVTATQGVELVFFSLDLAEMVLPQLLSLVAALAVRRRSPSLITTWGLPRQ